MELMKQFFRSYDLRMSIAGDKKGDDHEEDDDLGVSQPMVENRSSRASRN